MNTTLTPIEKLRLQERLNSLPWGTDSPIKWLWKLGTLIQIAEDARKLVDGG